MATSKKGRPHGPQRKRMARLGCPSDRCAPSRTMAGHSGPSVYVFFGCQGLPAFPKKCVGAMRKTPPERAQPHSYVVRVMTQPLGLPLSGDFCPRPLRKSATQAPNGSPAGGEPLQTQKRCTWYVQRALRHSSNEDVHACIHRTHPSLQPSNHPPPRSAGQSMQEDFDEWREGGPRISLAQV